MSATEVKRLRDKQCQGQDTLTTKCKEGFVGNCAQLTPEQRYHIQAIKKTGSNQTEIALAIGVDRSTVSRELVHNRGKGGCRSKQAHQ